MKHLLILWVFFILYFTLSPRYVESTENETSTQSAGFLGYFGNLWKNPWSNNEATLTQKSTRIHTSTRPTRTHSLVETSTTESAGLFNQVKNWMNVIKEKIPLNIQKTSTSRSSIPTSRETISVTSSTSSPTNSTQIFETSTIRKDHPTDRVTIKLNVSNAFTRNIKRWINTNVSVTESTVSNNSLLADFAETRSYVEISSEEKDEEDISSPKVPATTAITNASFTTPSTTMELINEISSDLDSNPWEKFGESESNNVSLATNSIEQNSQSEDAKIKPFIYLEKMNLISFPSSKLVVSSSTDDLTESTTETSEFTISRKKLSNVNKLTPVYFSFYNANDLVGNDSGLKREAESLPTVPSRIYFSGTRKRKSSRISKRRTRRKSKSTTDSSSSGSDSGFD